MSATARRHDPVDPVDPDDRLGSTESVEALDAHESIEESRGARGRRAAREHLRMVSPLRPERASRGVFALVVTGMLVLGMIVILVINTSLAQGAFTISELQAQEAVLTQQEQTLSEQVEAAAAPESLEQQARALGMVPSENPVFLTVPSGRVLGKPKPRRRGHHVLPAAADAGRRDGQRGRRQRRAGSRPAGLARPGLRPGRGGRGRTAGPGRERGRGRRGAEGG